MSENDASAPPKELLPGSGRQVIDIDEAAAAGSEPDGHEDATGALAQSPGEAERAPGEAGEAPVEEVERPAKLMRIGAMIKQLLDEVRQTGLDEPSRQRLRDVYELSLQELSTSLSPDLAAELDRMSLPFSNDIPTEAELRVAQAQLVGWLEGLFHGIQASLFAQQMAARNQLEEMRRPGLPPGAQPGGQADPRLGRERPGTYL